jgi:hypothetical protein
MGMGMEETEMEDDRDTEVQMQMEMVLGDASWPQAAVNPSPRCFSMPCPARLPCRTLTVLLIVTLFGIVCSLLSVW